MKKSLQRAGHVFGASLVSSAGHGCRFAFLCDLLRVQYVYTIMAHMWKANFSRCWTDQHC